MKTVKLNAADRIFNAVMDDIINLSYVPGDRLPSENELAAQYEVSRITVRKALNMLQGLGVIETRNGGGSYVQQFRFSRITDAAARIMVNHVSAEDIIQYRRVLETEALRTLKSSAVQPNDLNQLNKYCQAMKDCATAGDYDGFAEQDLSFHRYICKMSHNTLFVYSYDMLRSVMLEHMKSRYHIVELPEDKKQRIMLLAAEAHSNIVASIANGTCDTVLAQMLDGEFAEMPLSF